MIVFIAILFTVWRLLLQFFYSFFLVLLSSLVTWWLFTVMFELLFQLYMNLLQIFDLWVPWGLYIASSLVAQMVKNLPVMQETWVQTLGWEDSLEKGMATYSRVLAWRIPWIEKPGGLQSLGSQRVGHDWATSPKLFW